MPELMIFKEVIDEQGVSFESIIESEGGYYNDGDWVFGGPTKRECIGVILPISSGSNMGDALSYAEQGVYNVKDRKLLTVEDLPNGTEVQYNGSKYTIQSFKDLTAYTDVNIYLMRWREK